MRRDAFLAARRERWQRFEGLVKRAARDLSGLNGDELLEMGRLYRSVSSDLAIARREFPADDMTAYLNQLLARAHPVVYRERSMDLTRIGRFVRYGFPAAFRKAGPYIALSCFLFAFSALVAALRPPARK